MANCDNTVLLQKVKEHNPDRKFKVFFRPKLGDLQKKKKKKKRRSSPKEGLSAENQNSKVFFRPKIGDLQKKKVFAKIQNAEIQNSNVFSAQI